jgi:hypothetical protein
MSHSDCINYKSTITFKGRALAEKLVKKSADYTEMYHDVIKLTSAGDNLFVKLDMVYPAEETYNRGVPTDEVEHIMDV